MTTLLDQLETARPTQAALDSHLPADVLDRIKVDVARKAAQRARPLHRRRRVLAAVAATVAGVAIVPGLVGSDRSAAHADLTALAMVAANSDGPAITPGTFLHVKTEAVQRNSSLFGDGRTLDTNREQWVRWDGVIWVIDTRPSAGWAEYMVLPKNDWFTPERAAELPDNASELRAYLDRTVSGSNSHEEAIFVAITDWVHSNLLPPKTLAAALEVLADVDGVDTKDVTVRGRDAVEVSYNRFWHDLIASESIVIDRETARTISEHDSDPGGTYELETTLVEVVEEIPADVLRDFEAHKDDVRVYDDGHEPTADEM
ncbi:hypothetical protein [Mumia zhuanghuii]|uniref:CU044_5270 family protein n=1 Tax=Mumia zhuanghuii TaxID=2585211 RepID=A0A5C4MU90_9ACTN|nr:hypothetical protein [Mumia zhuanghuii]TNC47363.1 hypothetical protein FHE65_10120 [Mumia zhuanghuii]TNC47658.1 hypothetical protein FHE65_09245 [Mumia zhuanghuii]